LKGITARRGRRFHADFRRAISNLTTGGASAGCARKCFDGPKRHGAGEADRTHSYVEVIEIGGTKWPRPVRALGM